jgi:hypothetical protein
LAHKPSNSGINPGVSGYPSKPQSFRSSAFLISPPMFFKPASRLPHGLKWTEFFTNQMFWYHVSRLDNYPKWHIFLSVGNF